MDIKATHKNARMSPRKIRPVARILKGVSVKDAKTQLQFFPGKAAVIIQEVLKSAIANATHNYLLDEQNLVVRNILVSPGFVLKRFMPVSKGMAHAILKRTAHVTVIVGESQPTTKELKGKKGTIETITADEYATFAATEEPLPEGEKGDEKQPVAGKEKTENREVDAMSDKQNFEAFQKTKMMQQGGDPKKSGRRQSKKSGHK